MLSAIRVKSPFSHNAWFGFIAVLLSFPCSDAQQRSSPERAQPCSDTASDIAIAAFNSRLLRPPPFEQSRSPALPSKSEGQCQPEHHTRQDDQETVANDI